MSDETHRHTPIPSKIRPMRCLEGSYGCDLPGITQHTCECGAIGSQLPDSRLIHWTRKDGQRYVFDRTTVLKEAE